MTSECYTLFVAPIFDWSAGLLADGSACSKGVKRLRRSEKKRIKDRLTVQEFLSAGIHTRKLNTYNLRKLGNQSAMGGHTIIIAMIRISKIM